MINLSNVSRVLATLALGLTLSACGDSEYACDSDFVTPTAAELSVREFTKSERDNYVWLNRGSSNLTAEDYFKHNSNFKVFDIEDHGTDGKGVRKCTALFSYDITDFDTGTVSSTSDVNIRLTTTYTIEERETDILVRVY